MKILEQRYPLGSLKGQRTDGRYIDGLLYDNLKILAKNIVNDMTYLGVISSSTLEVGTGKSVFVQQIAEAYLEAVRQYHKIDNRLNMENICFRPKELIERAFQIPRFSVVILDEWEDQHYWSELGMSLRQFFRKCRQLNLFILVIIPNFFQLNINYAIGRSVFFIDVKFHGEFQRGYFSFYNFEAKRTLYLKGKKEQNYRVVKPNFTGRFADGYVVGEEEYRKAKYLDMLRAEKDEKKPLNEITLKRAICLDILERLKKLYPNITKKDCAFLFKVDKKTLYDWILFKKRGEVQENQEVEGGVGGHINYPIDFEPNDEEPSEGEKIINKIGV